MILHSWCVEFFGGTAKLTTRDRDPSINNNLKKDYCSLSFECVCVWFFFFRVDGTRIAAVSFGTEPRLEFNLGDPNVNTMKKAKEAIDKIMYMGGATASALALRMVRKVVVPQAREGSHRVMMFITDGKSNIGGPPQKEAEYLRDVEKFEIYAIGKTVHVPQSHE